MGLAAIRPLKLARTAINVGMAKPQVAVGLAAIRPLKLVRRELSVNEAVSCSGFGRYQAVETIGRKPEYLLKLRCSGFGRYQAVETTHHDDVRFHAAPVAVGLAAIRPLKPQMARAIC